MNRDASHATPQRRRLQWWSGVDTDVAEVPGCDAEGRETRLDRQERLPAKRLGYDTSAGFETHTAL